MISPFTKYRRSALLSMVSPMSDLKFQLSIAPFLAASLPQTPPSMEYIPTPMS